MVQRNRGLHFIGTTCAEEGNHFQAKKVWENAIEECEFRKNEMHADPLHKELIAATQKLVRDLIGQYGPYINTRKKGTSVKYKVPYYHIKQGLLDEINTRLNNSSLDTVNMRLGKGGKSIIMNVQFG